jgi:hypothetical protein
MLQERVTRHVTIGLGLVTAGGATEAVDEMTSSRGPGLLLPVAACIDRKRLSCVMSNITFL